jgi:DNA-binding GntR family transcriptional regulator
MSTIDLKKNALSNHIAEHIIEQIVTGELKPGEKLIELSYAEEFGISKAPVREAIYLLTMEGLVEKIPRKGAVVKGYTTSEIHDLLEIRIMLESLSMKRIAECGVDSEIIKKMESLLAEMQEQKEIGVYTQLNHSFHMCLIEMSQSEVIHNVYSRLKHPLQRIQNLSFSGEGNIKKSVAEHAIIVKLLKQGNVLDASRVLKKHNQDVIESIQQWLNKGI